MSVQVAVQAGEAQVALGNTRVMGGGYTPRVIDRSPTPSRVRCRQLKCMLQCAGPTHAYSSSTFTLSYLRGGDQHVSATSSAVPLPPLVALTYETVLCTELPAFDPVPTLRSVLLKPPHLQRFEYFLRKTGWLTMPIYGCGLILRIVVCSVPAPIGRLLSPWAAILHIPPCIVFAAGIRVEFVKLILSAFDFWFPFAANTMFLIVFSCETYFRDSRNIAMSAFVEASLLVLLMGSISLDIMDDLHHSNLIIAGGHTLSTKDVLINVIGTMATLMMRTMYRRVQE
ncbi:hypothetical protein JG688_00006653 [Phytophthora aleatoria]|uniref:Transmembrane protein n=1 Tax=Phytophthora aleatoria TaxID=2496075 RepID=A0A8J5J713_9STRA|nr:hypothetical protein JG688_00006653 [Phytophthora aleatoria]